MAVKHWWNSKWQKHTLVLDMVKYRTDKPQPHKQKGSEEGRNEQRTNERREESMEGIEIGRKEKEE